jgi:acyl-CoA synthetase (AMP-forming)/AMP-acid ligase II
MNATTPNTAVAITAATLTELLEANRSAARSITYLEGERESRSVAYGELYERALAILHRLQRLGARPGDHLILFLSGNEPFIDAFWAALLGGIIAVPVAPGISDEHRHKLLRIAAKLGAPFIYTEQRLLERLAATASAPDQQATLAALRPRAFLWMNSTSSGAPASRTARAPATSPSSSSPPAPPAHPRAWSSRTPIFWPISAACPRRRASPPTTSACRGCR